MVEDDRYCLGILTQLNALIAATRAVGPALLHQHARHRVKDGIEDGEGEEKVEELVADRRALRGAVKSRKRTRLDRGDPGEVVLA